MRPLLSTVVAIATLALATIAQAQDLSGFWDASVEVKGRQIPFRLKLAEDAKGVRANFFDGEQPTNPSSSGRRDGQRLRFEFASYATSLEARLDGQVLRGSYQTANGALPFEARRQKPSVTRVAAGPSIAGEWRIPLETPKGERAWRLIVRQKGGEAFATILRVDGDTGTLSGRYDGRRYVLSRFAGERPAILEITPAGDELKLDLHDNGGPRTLRAVRAKVAQAKGIAAPADPARHTRVRDPKETFRYAGVELDGAATDQNDPRFRNKVVVLSLMGSWCPNCHDEAPFLVELDRKYRSRGLQVVGLDFEQAEQLKNPQRLRAFIARYGIEYPVLLAGEPKSVNEKLPQAEGLNAWPTTFFIGRDGRVRNVHVGFPSRGSGPYETKARADIEREVQVLLAEKR
ncbi:MAG: TlpA disulfide reductase family protein [Caulobacter sp.]